VAEPLETPMKTFALAAAILTLPSVAMAQTPITPSLWKCLTEAKVQCSEGVCRSAPVASEVEVDLVNWSYARCSEGCFGGQMNDWSVTDGKLTIKSLTLPQMVTIRVDNTFTDMAMVDDMAFVSSGTCRADYSNGEPENPATLVESFEAWDAWQQRINAERDRP